MLFTPYQAMLMAQNRNQDLLHKAEQDRLMQVAQDRRRTRGPWPSLASLAKCVMNMADQKRVRKPKQSIQP